MGSVPGHPKKKQGKSSNFSVHCHRVWLPFLATYSTCTKNGNGAGPQQTPPQPLVKRSYLRYPPRCAFISHPATDPMPCVFSVLLLLRAGRAGACIPGLGDGGRAFPPPACCCAPHCGRAPCRRGAQATLWGRRRTRPPSLPLSPAPAHPCAAAPLVARRRVQAVAMSFAWLPITKPPYHDPTCPTKPNTTHPPTHQRTQGTHPAA